MDVHTVPEVAPDRHHEDGDEELVILVMMVDQILQKTQATMNHQMFTHIVKLKFHFPVISTVACEVMLKYLITNKTLQVQFHAEVI